jgi:hypothetical protein
MIILGLDVSTTTAGIAFVNIDTREIIHAGFVDISKTDVSKEKVFLIVDFIEKSKINFDRINLEASLSGFGGGAFKQQILIKLSRFNAITEYVIGEHYKMQVNLVNVSTARKKLFGRSRLKGVKSKQFVKDEIEKLFNLKKYEVITSRGNVDSRIEDVRDAIVTAFYN